MREIKFRVLDVPPDDLPERKITFIGYEALIDGVWHTLKGLSKTDGVRNMMKKLSSGYYDWTRGTFSGKYFKRLQYIELKDIHGKEMYEGDICKGDGFFEELYPKPKQIGVVEFTPLDEGCGFVIHNINNQCRGGEVFIKFNIEVIGNIYENPELL